MSFTPRAPRRRPLPPVRVNLYSDTQTKPSPRDEGRDDGGRGRRRAARRRPHGARALRPHGRAAGQGGRDVPALRHHVQPDRHPHPLPPRRRDPRPRDRAHHHQRRRRRRAPWPAPSCLGLHRRRAASSTPTRCARRSARSTPQRPAADACSRSSRPPMPAAARSGRSTQLNAVHRTSPTSTAWPPTWTARG